MRIIAIYKKNLNLRERKRTLRRIVKLKLIFKKQKKRTQANIMLLENQLSHPKKRKILFNNKLINP